MAVQVGTGFEEAVKDVPAMFVNRFQMAVSSAGFVRLTCGETFVGASDVRYRAAFVISIDDARQLAELITVTLAGHSRAALETATPPAKKDA